MKKILIFLAFMIPLLVFSQASIKIETSSANFPRPIAKHTYITQKDTNMVFLIIANYSTSDNLRDVFYDTNYVDMTNIFRVMDDTIRAMINTNVVELGDNLIVTGDGKFANSNITLKHQGIDISGDDVVTNDGNTCRFGWGSAYAELGVTHFDRIRVTNSYIHFKDGNEYCYFTLSNIEFGNGNATKVMIGDGTASERLQVQGNAKIDNNAYVGDSLAVNTTTPSELFNVDYASGVFLRSFRGTTDTDITGWITTNASGDTCYCYPNATGDGITISTTKP